MKTPLNALVVEDSEDDARLLVRELKKGGYELSHERVETADGLREALAHGRWDVVLCDFAFPRFSGEAALRIVKESGQDIPFIYVSGKIGEDVAVEAMKAGAHDYIMKNNLARLVPAVQRELREAGERRHRRQAEESMHVSEYKYRHLFESMSDAAFLIEKKTGKIIDTNAQAEALLGKPRARIVGMSQQQLWEPADAGHKIETSSSCEAAVRREDACIVPVHVSASSIELYGRECLLALVRDETERQRVEQDRQHLTRERLLILDSVMEGIYGIDLNGCCTFINPVAAKMLGYRPEEVMGRDMHQLIHSLHPDASPYPVEECSIHRALRKGEVCHIDSECFQRKDGTLFPVEYSASPIRENNEVIGAVVAFSDLTEKKSLEARFLRAQRLESIGQLAGGIAHDLNNILAPIMMCTPLLRAEIKSESGLSTLNTIEFCARRGADIVKQVLTFAKGIGDKKTLLQPRYLLGEVAKFIRETFPKSIILAIDPSPEVWLIPGDATQLHQVFLNLAVNARDAMPDGGTLRMKAENFQATDEEVREIPEIKPGTYVLFRIADTGMGISPEIASRIFDPFFTTKSAEKGTGLGLSTVMSIVKNHGGIVRFKSEKGQGTEFQVYLPAEAGKASVLEPVHERPIPQGKGQRVLIVDDEEAVRSITKHILEAHGYRTLTASDGTSAVGLYAAKKEKIDLVLIDLNMPFMGGNETIQALRKLNPLVKVVITTGSEMVMENMEGTAMAFLEKPFDAPALLEALQEALKKEVS